MTQKKTPTDVCRRRGVKAIGLGGTAMAASSTFWNMLKHSVKTGHLDPVLTHPGLFRGVNDGRYKFARYLAPHSITFRKTGTRYSSTVSSNCMTRSPIRTKS